MARFTIRRNGTIVGTYAGTDEEAALDAMARDEKDADFKTHCTRTALRRDDYKLEPVKE